MLVLDTLILVFSDPLRCRNCLMILTALLRVGLQTEFDEAVQYNLILILWQNLVMVVS